MDFKSELRFDPITPKYQPIMDGLEHSKVLFTHGD